MKSFLRKWRKENLNKIGKYLLYALGEILLIIIGILIIPLLKLEKRFDTINDKVRSYFDSKLYDFDLNELKNDRQFKFVAAQKYNISKAMRNSYEYILKEQNELKKLIEMELEEKCNIK